MAKKPVNKQDEVVVEEAVVEEVVEEFVGENVEENVEVVEVTEASEVVDDGDKPFEVYEYKLKIHENKIVSIPAGVNKVVVENVGGGDLYVDVISVSFLPKNLVQPGESKEFKGIEALFIGSASRPAYRISLFK